MNYRIGAATESGCPYGTILYDHSRELRGDLDTVREHFGTVLYDGESIKRFPNHQVEIDELDLVLGSCETCHGEPGNVRIGEVVCELALRGIKRDYLPETENA